MGPIPDVYNLSSILESLRAVGTGITDGFAYVQKLGMLQRRMAGSHATRLYIFRPIVPDISCRNC